MTVRIQIFNLSYCMNVLISQPLSISFTMKCLYMSENKIRNRPQWSIYSFFAPITYSTLSFKKKTSDSTRMAWISIHAWRILARSRQQRQNQHRWKHQLYSGFWFLHQSHIIQVSTTSFFINLVGDKGGALIYDQNRRKSKDYSMFVWMYFTKSPLVCVSHVVIQSNVDSRRDINTGVRWLSGQ